MSRAKRERARTRGREMRPPRAHSLGRRLAAPIAALLVAAFAYAVVRGRAPRDAGTAAAPSPADSAARLPMSEAYDVAAWRLTHGDPLGSIPYYRRVRDTMTNDRWEFHFEYGAALQNAALAPGVRASHERVALAKEALEELARAARDCPGPKERAVIRLQRALVHTVWGFPNEAYDECLAALADDPGNKDALASVENVRRFLAAQARAER